MGKQVAVIDYGMSNLFSVARACEHVGLTPVITHKPKDLLKADAAILPGVGAFGEAMRCLQEYDLVGPIKDFIAQKKPFMGICLGMQLLMQHSEEFGDHQGLDIFKGNVMRFPPADQDGKKIKVPQMGWNSIFPRNDKKVWTSKLLEGTAVGEYMYFVHSFYVRADNEQDILSITDYEGVKYCSSIGRDNVWAFQFHPERSAGKGMLIYNNFSKLIHNSKEPLL